MKDYYEILEVHHKASSEIIKKAYITLAKRYHPDSSNYDGERMKDLNEAYDILLNEYKRAEYDAKFLKQSHQSPQQDASVSMHQAIAMLCKEISDNCTASIIKDDCFSSKNFSHASLAYERFNKEVAPLIDKLTRLSSDYELIRDAKDWGVATLFSIATAFTWASAYSYSEALLNRALNNYAPHGDMREKVVSMRNDMTKSVNIIRDREQQNKNITANEGITGTKLTFGKIFVGSGLIFIIFVLIALSNTNLGNNSNAQSAKQIQGATPTSTKTNASKNNFVPILDKPTGYNPSFKQLLKDGVCEVKIDNSGNDHPVQVGLYYIGGNEFRARDFYIQKKETFTAKNIPPGRYSIRFKNLQSGSCFKTQDFSLEKIETTDGYKYSIMEFTLFTVRGGNARLEPIGEDEFM